MTNDDLLDVRALVERYAWAVDDYDADGVVECFAPGARFVSADMVLEGHEAIRSFFAVRARRRCITVVHALDDQHLGRPPVRGSLRRAHGRSRLPRRQRLRAHRRARDHLHRRLRPDRRGLAVRATRAPVALGGRDARRHLRGRVWLTRSMAVEATLHRCPSALPASLCGQPSGREDEPARARLSTSPGDAEPPLLSAPNGVRVTTAPNDARWRPPACHIGMTVPRR